MDEVKRQYLSYLSHATYNQSRTENHLFHQIRAAVKTADQARELIAYLAAQDWDEIIGRGEQPLSYREWLSTTLYELMEEDVRRERFEFREYICQKCDGSKELTIQIGFQSWERLCPDCYQELARKCTQPCMLCGSDYTKIDSYHYHPTDQTVKLCDNCRTKPNSRIAKQLLIHLIRARKFRLENSLTMKEWLKTLSDFSDKCAYCQNAPATTMEHFIPILLGGGTTRKNCVPSCQSCNSIKGKTNPLISGIAGVPFTRIQTIANYLSQR